MDASVTKELFEWPPMTVHGWLRYDVVHRLVPNDAHSVLEIGAGRGALGSIISRSYDYVGLEPDFQSFGAAHTLVGKSGTVLHLPEEEYDARRFDVVCALEVLEHIEDDVAALRRWQRHLRAGGSVILSVPAGRSRYGPTDERQGHFRRYDRRDLDRVLTEAGFSDVTVVTYGFPIGYVLHAVSDFQARRRPRAADMRERTAASGAGCSRPTRFLEGRHPCRSRSYSVRSRRHGSGQGSWLEHD